MCSSDLGEPARLEMGAVNHDPVNHASTANGPVVQAARFVTPAVLRRKISVPQQLSAPFGVGSAEVNPPFAIVAPFA